MYENQRQKNMSTKSLFKQQASFGIKMEISGSKLIWEGHATIFVNLLNTGPVPSAVNLLNNLIENL